MSLNVTPFVSQKTQIFDVENAKKLYNLEHNFSFYKNAFNDHTCQDCGPIESGVINVSNALSTYATDRYCLDCYDNKYNTKI